MADTATAVERIAPLDAAVPPADSPAGTGSAWAWAGLAVFFAARAYRALLVTLAVVATLPLLWSWTSHVIRSGSMEPSIAVGDVVVARPFTAAEDVPLGRVMVFVNPAVPERGQLLVHRVVSDLGQGEWATAGDANRDVDATPVTRDDLRSRAMLLVEVEFDAKAPALEQLDPLSVHLDEIVERLERRAGPEGRATTQRLQRTLQHCDDLQPVLCFQCRR